MVGIFRKRGEHEVAAVGGILQIRSMAFSKCRNFYRDSPGRTAVNERKVSTDQEDKACLFILSTEESSIANLRHENRPLGIQEAHFKALFIIECWRVR